MLLPAGGIVSGFLAEAPGHKQNKLRLVRIAEHRVQHPPEVEISVVPWSSAMTCFSSSGPRLPNTKSHTIVAPF